MGYYIFSYAIDANKIKSAFGSKDQELLDTTKNTESYEAYSDIYASFEGQLSTEKALEDIINGNKMDVYSGPAYGYALICLCEAMGIKSPYTEDIKLGKHTDLINQYLEEDFGIDDIDIEEMLLMENSNPFTIPPIGDFPAIGFLDCSALKVLKQMFDNVDIPEEVIEKLIESKELKDAEKGMIYDNIKGIIQNIDYCIANKLELISFCH
jgi:hypothetical protein